MSNISAFMNAYAVTRILHVLLCRFYVVHTVDNVLAHEIACRACGISHIAPPHHHNSFMYVEYSIYQENVGFFSRLVFFG